MQPLFNMFYNKHVLDIPKHTNSDNMFVFSDKILKSPDGTITFKVRVTVKFAYNAIHQFQNWPWYLCDNNVTTTVDSR